MYGSQGDPATGGPDRTEEARHGEWNRRVRGETDTERLDRNFGQLLQELRVLQTGVQLLTGLLLILPFQDGFEDLGAAERGIYLVTVAFAMMATIVLVAPVAWHRVLFRRRRLADVVAVAHRCAVSGMALLGLALTGVVVLIGAAVINMVAAALLGLVTGLLFFTVWWLAPMRQRRRPAQHDDSPPSLRGLRGGTTPDTADTPGISPARRRSSGLLPRQARLSSGRAEQNGGAPPTLA